MQGGGRLLGLDLGSKTIGQAICDSGWLIASPVETLKRQKFTQDAAALAAFIKAEDIMGLVLGWPVHLDGSEGRRCQSTLAFHRNFSKILPLPTLLWDERLTSYSAELDMHEAGMRKEHQARRIDAMAARIILQSAIDRLRQVRDGGL